MAEIDTQTVQIAAGQNLSGEIDIGSKGLVGIGVPANWTTAGLSFQVSTDGGNSWGELWDGTAGTEFVVPSLVGGTLQYYVGIDPTKLRGAQSFKIRSGTQAAPVTQVNLVTLTLITKIVT
jgi:hypothetical protein